MFSIHLIPIFLSPSLHFWLKPSSTTPLTLYFHCTFILLPNSPRQPLNDHHSGNSKFFLLFFFSWTNYHLVVCCFVPTACIVSLAHVLCILQLFNCGWIKCKVIFQLSYLLLALCSNMWCFHELLRGMSASTVWVECAVALCQVRLIYTIS